MNRYSLCVLIIAVFDFTAPEVFALGRDFSKEALEREGVFVKGQIPIHGYHVNWEDVFFYTGDAKAFNKFMEVYSNLKHVKLKVVIHPGTKSASSPWDPVPRDMLADWSFSGWGYQPVLTVGLGGERKEIVPVGEPTPTRVDVWLGNKRLKLQDLRIPTQIEVVAAREVEEGNKPLKIEDMGVSPQIEAVSSEGDAPAVLRLLGVSPQIEAVSSEEAEAWSEIEKFIGDRKKEKQ
jgi:hypothetical protein